ncbi:MAG: hypothetical protein WCG82_08935, partial [Bacteroidota bacterium]
MKIKIFFLILISVLSITASSGQKNNKKIIVSGLVTDAQKKPVAGAMILIDKKNTNIVTDSKGFYKIKIRPDAGLITVFTLNNGVREAIIEGRTTINFSLSGTASSQNNKRDNNEADKAVNIGYGSVDPKNLTTQVNRLDVKDNKYASYSNIYEVLRGTVPGVQVSG